MVHWTLDWILNWRLNTGRWTGYYTGRWTLETERSTLVTGLNIIRNLDAGLETTVDAGPGTTANTGRWTGLYYTEC